MKKTMIILMALTLMAGAAAADVLWDQTAGYEGWQMGFFNNIAGGPPFGSTNYTVNDVVVPAGNWLIDSVKIYYDGFNPGWAGAVTSAILYMEPKTGSLPTGDPTTGTAVTVSCVGLGNGFLELSATGLNLGVEAGEYWIGLTPNTPDSDNIHVSVVAVGDDSPSYDPNGFPMPMWMGWAPGLDGAMLIEGITDVVATENISLGSIKALFR